MSKFWTKPLYGTVSVRIMGKYTELFINRCLEKGILIWNIRRISNDTIVLRMYLKDALMIRPILKECRCKIHFLNRKGLPFFLKRVSARSGFVIGLVCFFIIVFLLSNMVWNVKVTGADPKLEHRIYKVLEEIDLKRGKFIFQLPDEREIQNYITDRVPELTWIGVTLKGTTYQFQVVEKELPEEVKRYSPRNLVAEKKAVITKMFVEQGQAMVEVNDYVQKGEVLVSGILGQEENTKIIPAKGKVYGEVWYTSEVTIPLKSTFETLTGDHYTKHYISIFGLEIPVWGFKSVDYKQYERNGSEKTFRFIKWNLPITYSKLEILESQTVERNLTVEEAVKVGKQMALEDLENMTDEDTEIKSSKILHQRTDNGKVKLVFHFKVIEEITKSQPIVRGD